MQKNGSLPIIVVAALLTRGGKILIAQRPPGTRLAGKWEFPGGKVEPGEDPRAALARECREELGVEIEAGGIYESIYTSNSGNPILLLFYTARLLAGEPVSLEGNALAWASVAEMADYPILEADLPLVRLFEVRFPSFLPDFVESPPV